MLVTYHHWTVWMIADKSNIALLLPTNTILKWECIDSCHKFLKEIFTEAVGPMGNGKGSLLSCGGVLDSVIHMQYAWSWVIRVQLGAGYTMYVLVDGPLQ
jgi:hypothetical protein